jgi:hypothetical protein
MLPWNFMCPLGLEVGEGGDDVVGGIQSRWAREKPPTSASEKSLQSCGEEGSWKEART